MSTERGDYQVPGWLSQLESSAQRAWGDRPRQPPEPRHFICGNSLDIPMLRLEEE